MQCHVVGCILFCCYSSKYLWNQLPRVTRVLKNKMLILEHFLLDCQCQLVKWWLGWVGQACSGACSACSACNTAVTACILNYRVEDELVVHHHYQGNPRHSTLNIMLDHEVVNNIRLFAQNAIRSFVKTFKCSYLFSVQAITSNILNVLVLSSAQKKSGHDQLELFKRQSIKLFIEFELNFIDFKLNNEYIQESDVTQYKARKMSSQLDCYKVNKNKL